MTTLSQYAAMTPEQQKEDDARRYAVARQEAAEVDAWLAEQELAQSPEVVAAANQMVVDSTDYFPALRNGQVFGDTAGLPAEFMLYAYNDGIWLVLHNDACEMGDATKLVCVIGF